MGIDFTYGFVLGIGDGCAYIHTNGWWTMLKIMRVVKVLEARYSVIAPL